MQQEYTPRQDGRQPAADSNADGDDRWKPLLGSEIRKREHPPRRWLARGILREKEIGRASGPSKSFKSFFVAQLAVSVASGCPFLGCFAVEKAGPVLIIQEEVAEDDYDLRLTGLMGDLPDDVVDNILVLSRRRFVLDRSHAGFQAHEQIIAERGVVLVIYDNLTRIYPPGFHENEAPVVAEMLGLLAPLQDQYGTSVLLVHHDRKRMANDFGPSARGSMVLDAFPDVLINLERGRHHRDRAKVSIQGRGFSDGEFGVRFDEDQLRLVFDEDGPPTEPTARQQDTIQALRELGGTGMAQDVANHLGVKLDAARKRLDRLADAGTIDRNMLAVPSTYSLRGDE